ncbi:MAG: hypothetical protein GY847_13705 [Proteobacteria bacterium]|nr:hypothetical protein [Pseudomonadota bacterium]
MRSSLFVLLTIACLASGCGVKGRSGNNPESSPVASSKQSSKAPVVVEVENETESKPESKPVSRKIIEGSNEEILPSFLKQRPGLIIKTDAGTPPMPTGRDDLLKRARQVLKAGDLDEALAFVDVLILMNPGDPELLEFRGTALLRQGHTEDAMVDLKRCCDLGRQTCCRWKNTP